MIPRIPACLRSARPKTAVNRCRTIVTPSSSYRGGVQRSFQPKKGIIGKTIQNRLYAGSVFIKPDRKPEFKQLDEADVKFFEQVVGKSHVLQSERDLESLNEDWMGKYIGNSKVAVRPKTTEEVSKLLAYCNKNRIAVVPQGGNTGLVGGSVPVHDELILSMSRMNQIRSFDAVSGVLVADAGSILHNVDQYLMERDHIFPLDLGAKGSCHIGGNVSTNAGGIRFLRYGSLHGSVLGLEVVMANGEILNALSTLRKDNTGYDVKQLFIGSEGSLGVITAVSVLCPPRPKSVNVVFLAVSSFENCQQIMTAAKQQLGEILSAYEFLDNLSFQMVLDVHKDRVRNPLPSQASTPFYVLFETHGSNQEHDKSKVDSFLEYLLDSGLIEDGVVSQDESQAKSLWFIRESVPESINKTGKVYKYDISIPVAKMYDIVTDIRGRLAKVHPGARVSGYGHMGDSNLHLNIVEPAYTTETLNIVEPYVYEWTSSVGGSISAEHGIGVMKPNHLHYSKSPVAIEVMKGLKKSLDPNGILNPYKTVPL